jgi:hypothetical protein
VRIRARVGEHVINADTFNNTGLALPEVGQPTTLYIPPHAVMLLQNK